MRIDFFLRREFLEQGEPSALSRVDFGTPKRQKEFFRNARGNNRNWRELYSELVALSHVSVTFRRFRRWYLGQALPVADVVSAICLFTGQKLTELNVVIKEPNWGRKKGGYNKVAISGCNLTMLDRVRGGRSAGMSNSVDHLKSIASLGGSSLIKSMKNPGRKVLGPTGLRMFNYLERDTMLRMISAGIHPEYEPVIKVGSRRIIPDFRVGDTYIECTRDPKASVKAFKLAEKFRLLKEYVSFRKGIVVTLPGLLTRYRLYLPSDVEVTTAQDFLTKLMPF